MEKTKNSLLAPYVDRMFKNIRPSWKKILYSPKIKPILFGCLNELEKDLLNKGVTYERVMENGLGTYIRPAPEDIFAPYTFFDAHNLRSIVIGQDPYDDKNHAHGICFSSPSSKTPPSLAKIFATLRSQDLISAAPATNNLSGWCRQGILMINYYLTRTPNIVKSSFKDSNGANVTQSSIEGNGAGKQECLHTFWGKLTDAILAYLSETYFVDTLKEQKRNIYVMLWGNFAERASSHIISQSYYGFKVLTWGHPSPLNRANQKEDDRKNFLYCDHFRKVSNEYSTINWDPEFVTTENLNDRFWTYRICNAVGGPIANRQARNALRAVLDTKSAFHIYDDCTDTIENLEIRKYISERLAIKASTPAPIVEASDTVLTPEASVVAETPKESDPKEPELKESDLKESDLKEPEPEKPKEPNDPRDLEKPKSGKVVMFIDGGCKGNGRADAFASIGVYCPPIYGDAQTLTGEMEIAEKLSDFAQIYDVTSKKRVDQTKSPMKHTNQRAELTALIRSIEAILAMDITTITNVVTVTDSDKYVVSWTAKGRLWKEFAVDKSYRDIPNRDLVAILCRYVWTWARAIKPGCSFEDSKTILMDSGYWTVQWVEAHQDKKLHTLTGKDLEHAKGNIRADQLVNRIAKEHGRA
jgi:uracil-DNA glycosylase